jgi:hypothetical protein
MNFIFNFLFVLQWIVFVSGSGSLDGLVSQQPLNVAFNALFKSSLPVAKEKGVLSSSPEIQVPETLTNFGSLFNAGIKQSFVLFLFS